MPEMGDLLAATGYSSGDFLGVVSHHHATNASTTSNSYSSYQGDDLTPVIIWDQVFPSSVQTQVAVLARVNPSTDQIDIRLQNLEDSETAAELTGTTGSIQEIVIGPVDYTPTTASSGTFYRIQHRNNDNSTSVTTAEATVVFGVEL